jgi:hypothetical protein
MLLVIERSWTGPLFFGCQSGRSHWIEQKAGEHAGAEGTGVEVDAVGAAVDLMVSGDRVAVHHGVGQAVGPFQEGLADPDQVLIPLLLQGHARAHACMNE